NALVDEPHARVDLTYRRGGRGRRVRWRCGERRLSIRGGVLIVGLAVIRVAADDAVLRAERGPPRAPHALVHREAQDAAAFGQPHELVGLDAGALDPRERVNTRRELDGAILGRAERDR